MHASSNLFSSILYFQAPYMTTIGNHSNEGSFSNGFEKISRFNGPIGVAVGPNNFVHVADFANSMIRSISPSNVVTTLLSTNFPSDVGFDNCGSIYVVNNVDHKIEKISSTGVSVLIFGSGQPGNVDGFGKSASFSSPFSIVVADSSEVFVSDSGNNEIRMISSSGMVTNVAGWPSNTVFNDGFGTAATFNDPSGIAMDTLGFLYVADTLSNRIRKVTTSGKVATLAGSGDAEWVDGGALSASFYWPRGVAVDNSGNVFVSDTGNNALRMITPSHRVYTIGGHVGGEFADGSGTNAAFAQPHGLAVDSSGNIFVADKGNNVVRRVTVPTCGPGQYFASSVCEPTPAGEINLRLNLTSPHESVFRVLQSIV